MGSDLAEGVKAISLNQTVVFTKYVRLVLPLDSYVFWVRADLVTSSALYNAARFNAFAYNQAPRIISAAPTLVVQGSIHYATQTNQNEDETLAIDTVIFTSLEEVQDLNEVGPTVLYIGEFDGRKFAFSSRKSWYQQADLWHYVGNAVYPDMETQLVDSLVGFDRSLIVSNSLPAWLSLNGYKPAYGFGNPVIPLFPSFLVPANIAPPFAAVHIPPESTRALASTQMIGPDSSLAQLCSEHVKITIWGTHNNQALDFVACVNQWTLDKAIVGIMNMPVMRDEKRTQAELGTIAMKKTVDFEISYHQRRINDVARQFIKSSLIAVYPQESAA